MVRESPNNKRQIHKDNENNEGGISLQDTNMEFETFLHSGRNDSEKLSRNIQKSIKYLPNDNRKGNNMLNWITVNGVGKTITIKDIDRGPASIAAPKFLDEFHNKYIKQCNKYFRATEDIPFNYSELRMHSFMIPALDLASDAVFAEQPINKNGRSGRVDYLVLSGNQLYLIELKHSWLSYNSGNATNTTVKRWENALSDLNDVSWENAFSLFSGITTVAKIALMVVPLYDSSKNLNDLAAKSYGLDNILEKYETFSGQLKPKANWSSIWAVKTKMAKPQQFKSGSYERYPAVALFANIEGQTK